MDDLARDGVRERDVGADVEPEPEIRPLRRRGAAGVDDDGFAPRCTALSAWWNQIGCASRVFEPQSTMRSAISHLLVGARPAACTRPLPLY